MVCKNFNSLVNKVGSLVTYQNKQTAKSCKNDFVNEFCCHNYNFLHNAFASTHLVV
jgi:hypothetical protein